MSTEGPPPENAPPEDAPPADAAPAEAAPAEDAGDRERASHALRIAVGVTIAFTVPIVLEWRLSFMAAVFTILLLAASRTPPTIRQCIGFIIVFAIATQAALIVTIVFRGAPAALVLATGVALFITLRASAQGRAPMPITLTLIAFTAMPFIVISEQDAAPYMQGILVGGGAVAFPVAWLAYLMFPSRAAAAPPAPAAAPEAADEAEAVRKALCATVVLVGAEIFALISDIPSRFVVVMTTVSIAQHYTRVGGLHVALGLLIANLIGGVAATVAYEILSFAPSPWLLVAVTLLGGLVFGRLIAAGGPRAPLFVPAFIALIILLGSSLSPITDDAGQLFSARFMAVLVAAAIACTGLALLDAATRRRPAARPVETAEPAEPA